MRKKNEEDGENSARNVIMVLCGGFMHFFKKFDECNNFKNVKKSKR